MSSSPMKKQLKMISPGIMTGWSKILRWKILIEFFKRLEMMLMYSSIYNQALMSRYESGKRDSKEDFNKFDDLKEGMSSDKFKNKKF